ncbi:hypothetical protein ACIBO2_49665 [Nonomuraea sp. NPDC050022]|uniref:hypothetical protein n=1 Tax=unclassified Nonomuraea TaxID=2593643 RepID=UPI0033D19BA1
MASRWEYAQIFITPVIKLWLSPEGREDLDRNASVIDILNKVGADGWELATHGVGDQEITYTFKRELY